MLNKLLTVCLLVVGIINFLPVIGALGIKNLESTYQVNIGSNDLLLLMQHRAILFGILGSFILASCIFPLYQPAAMLMAAISMLSYVALLHTLGITNHALLKVLYIDYVGIFFLILAVLIKYVFIRN